MAENIGASLGAEKTRSKMKGLRESIRGGVEKKISKQNRGVNAIIQTGRDCDVETMAVTVKKEIEGSVGVHAAKAHVGVHGKYKEESEVSVVYKADDE